MKNRWSYFALSLTTIFAIANCGGKTKLSEEQKGQFKQVITSTGHAASGVMNARNAGAAGVSSMLSASGATSDAEAEKIATYIRGKKCDFTISPDPSKEAPATTTPENPLGAQNFKFSAGGADCPVAATFGFDVNSSGDMKTSANIKMAWNFSFEIKDAELKKLSDVSKFSLKGELNINAANNSANISGNTSGEIISAKFGNIILSGDIKGSGDKGGGSAEGKFVTKFPTHEVELKFEADKGSQKFYLNGEPQTKEQLAELFKVSLPGKGGPATESVLPGDVTAATGFTNLLNLIQ